MYTSVAIPLLQSRPADHKRGTVAYVSVPGGLASHEGAPPTGGHTFVKHLNVTNQDLVDRVTTSNTKMASRWIDLRTAERIVAQVIGENPDTIAAWLASNGPITLALHLGGGGAVTGWAVTKTDHTAREVTGARVVLKKDPSRPGGYFIVSSFPEP